MHAFFMSSRQMQKQYTTVAVKTRKGDKDVDASLFVNHETSRKIAFREDGFESTEQYLA